MKQTEQPIVTSEDCNPQGKVAVRSGPEDALYRQNVNRLMAISSSEIIQNGLPQHAAALLECFFRNATSEIKIVCNRLRSDVYDAPDVLSSFLSAVRRGVSIQILVRETPDEQSAFNRLAKELTESGKSNLFVRTDTAKESSLIASTPESFAVMDRKAIRYEIDSIDSTKCEAVASMNLPPLAHQLAQVFDRLYSSICIKVETPISA